MAHDSNNDDVWVADQRYAELEVVVRFAYTCLGIIRKYFEFMKILLLIFSLFFFYSAILSKAFANNLSIKQEIERALDSGLNLLNLEQNKSSGQWGLEEYPALTGLAVRSCFGHPSKT